MIRLVTSCLKSPAPRQQDLADLIVLSGLPCIWCAWRSEQFWSGCYGLLAYMGIVEVLLDAILYEMLAADHI